MLILGIFVFLGLFSLSLQRGWLNSLAERLQPSPSPQGQIVYGKLTDPVGLGISGATVLLGTYQAKTNSGGNFSIRDVQQGLYVYVVFDNQGRQLQGPRVSLTVAVTPYEPVFLNLGGFELAQ